MNCFEQQRTDKPLQRCKNRDIGQSVGYGSGCFLDYESTALPLSYGPQLHSTKALMQFSKNRLLLEYDHYYNRTIV